MFIVKKENESNFLELIKENNYLLVGFDANYNTTEITNFLIEIAFGYEDETQIKPSVYLENISFESQGDFKETLLNFIADKTLPEIFVNGVALHEINKTELNSKKRKKLEPEAQLDSAPAPASLLPPNAQFLNEPTDEAQRRKYYNPLYRTGVFSPHNALTKNESSYFSEPAPAKNLSIPLDEEETTERPLQLRNPPKDKPQPNNLPNSLVPNLTGFSSDDAQKSTDSAMGFSAFDEYQGFTLPADDKFVSAFLEQEDQNNHIDPNELLAAGITEEQLAQWDKEDQIENDLLDEKHQAESSPAPSSLPPKPGM